MTTIKKLTQNTVVNTNDLFVIWDSTNSSTRNVTAATLTESIERSGPVVRTGGFIDYNDTSTTASPVPLVANIWTQIPNDGLGGATNKLYPPNGVTELMDTSTGSIDCSELNLGAGVFVRNDFKVIPNTNNSLLEFRYTLGIGGNAYTLETTLGRLDSGSGKEYRRALVPHYIYMGDTNTKDNPIGIEVRLSAAGTFVISCSVIEVRV